jgi:hypothetical protein
LVGVIDALEDVVEEKRVEGDIEEEGYGLTVM